MILKTLVLTLLSCSWALAQTTIYGLTITRTQTTDPTGTSCSNALEFAVNGTKWLACAGGVWQIIGAATGGGTPVGQNGQIQYNNSGSFGGFTIGGDGTLNASTGLLSITKTNGTAFAPSAVIDTTNAANISSGILSASRLPASINGTSVPVNGSGDTVLGTTSAAAGGWFAIPNCQDASGNHLNYNTATHSFGCGTSSSGGSGGAAPGGSAGQIQFNNSGSLSGFTMNGDGTLNASTGTLTIAKINGGLVPASARILATNAAGQVVATALPETWAVAFCGSGTCANDAPINRWPVRFGSTGAATCVFDAQTAPSSPVTVDMKRTSDNTSILGGPVQLNGRTFPYVFTAATGVPLTVGTDTIAFSLTGTSGLGITASCYAY
jgi:hypothetical protein